MTGATGAGKYEELVQLFNEYLIDLGTVARLFEEQALPLYQKGLDGCPYALGLFRICNSFAILTLNKLRETLKDYGEQLKKLEPKLLAKKTELARELKKLPIQEFRNIYVAHHRDEKTKSPVKYQEAYNKYIEEIFGKSKEEYISFYSDWLSPKEEQGVVHFVQELREACRDM